ncbi:MAG: hypothetical protein ACK4S3_05640, partial [Parvibaculum sp.]
MSGMNKQGRPTSIANTAHGGSHSTFTGNKALELEEPLLFELDNPGACGVDLDKLRADLVGYIDTDLANLATQREEDAKPTAGFQRV